MTTQQQFKRVTLNQLISYILESIPKDENDVVSDGIFINVVKSDDSFKFEKLSYRKTRNINDFPTNLKKIFDPFIKDTIRYGSKEKLTSDSEKPNENVNMSLYFSIMTLLVDDFYEMPSDEQLTFIIRLRDKLVLNLSSMEYYNNSGYKDLFKNKKELLKSVVNMKSNKVIMKIIADYFGINMFLLNIDQDKIFCISGNESYDLFRHSIFLSCHEENFEPLIYKGNKCIDCFSPLMRKLIFVDRSLICLVNPDIDIRDFIPFKMTINSIHNDIKQERIIEEIEEVKKPDPSVVFNISSKMKLHDLQIVAEKLSLDLNKQVGGKGKPKTKIELIDEIKDKLQSIDNFDELGLENL